MAELETRYRNAEAKAAGRISGYAAVFYDPDRRPKQKYVTLRTRDGRIARRRLGDLEKKESLGLFDPWRDRAPEYGVTLDEVIGRYGAARTEKRERTRSEDAKTLKRFQRTLPPAVRLENVEGRHVERFIDAPKPDGSKRQPATRRRYHNVLKKFFDWCVAEGLVEQHPMERMRPPKVYRKEARFLTPAELEQLLAQIDSAAKARALPEAGGRTNEVAWLSDAVRVQAGTGLRIGELASLRWSAVQLDKRRVIVGRQDLTKAGHERVVPVAGDALHTLMRLDKARPTRDGQAFVLTAAEGGRLNEARTSKRIKAYADRAGLGDDVTSHTIRHTYGAMLASEGVPLFMIQRLMGHESVETTNRYYGHLYPDKLHAAVEGVFG